MGIPKQALAAASVALILGLGVQMPDAEAATVTKKLLWSQEFSGKAGTSVSGTTWNYDIGDGTESGIPGWGNSEREYYIPGAVKHDGKGSLAITATRMPVDLSGQTTAKNPYACYYGTACEWTSGKITTYGKVSFQYGRMEARIKMPKGIGMWPAFWMLGNDIKTNNWPSSGEIDIIEAKGVSPKTAYGTVHGPGYSGGDGIGGHTAMKTFNYSGFNNYAIEWKPDQIKWLLNDKVFFTLNKADVKDKTWVFNKEFYLVLNLAVGGQFTGDVDPDLKKGALYVEWIRYYSVGGVGKVTKY
jgi:beta-glucanase (GH16 family)